MLFKEDLDEMGHNIPPRALSVVMVEVGQKARISDLGVGIKMTSISR